MNQIGGNIYVKILEQPARSAVRFRYECEGRSAGPIPGVSSSSSCATYPTIQVCHYSGGRALVVVSCVTVSQPYHQHPHHLVGRVGCNNGVCTMIIDNADHICTFTHLGIQCAKRNEISSRLRQRKQMQIDPTNAGFDHIGKSSRSIDLGAIRLCFQVYVEDPFTGKFTVPLEPVISDTVHDKKLLPKLIITDISRTSAPITGGKLMIFCNYIDEDDIEVRFFETDHSNGSVVWESIADLKPPIGEVHKRVGISLIAPQFRDPGITEPKQVFLQLRRPSDQRTSDTMIFTYLPDCSDNNCPVVKYHQLLNAGCNQLSQMIQTSTHHQSVKRSRNKSLTTSSNGNLVYNKKPKVMNVINCSDSDCSTAEDSNETMPEEINTTYSYNSNNDSHLINNHNINYNNQEFTNNTYCNTGTGYGIYHNTNNDYDNNDSVNTASVTINGNVTNNDLLVECLKTIDFEYLAANDLYDYTEDDWSALQCAINDNSVVCATNQCKNEIIDI